MPEPFDHEAALREGLAPLTCPGTYRGGRCGAVLAYMGPGRLHLSAATVTYNRVVVRCIRCGRPHTWRPGSRPEVDTPADGTL